MGADTSYSSTLLLQMDYVLCPFQKLSESYQGRVADMGCIEAHGERRQIVDSKSFVYPCLSMDMEANYLKADCVH